MGKGRNAERQRSISGEGEGDADAGVAITPTRSRPTAARDLPQQGGGFLIAILLRLLCVSAAQASPLCVAPARHQESLVSVNSFAENPAPQPIAPGRGRCGWGIGLALNGADTGTAFIVANRREIATSLHVVDKGCRGRRQFTFSHGYDLGHALSTETATVVARGDYCAKLAGGRHDYGGDWAIAVLDRDPLTVEPPVSAAETMPLEPAADWHMDDGRYYLLGYGMSFHGGAVPYRSAQCWLGERFGDGAIEHDCDAGHRGSGAPIVTEDTHGACRVVAMHDGEIADVPGRPAYRAGVNANVAVLASGFGATARLVARELDEGLNADEIAADLARHPGR